MFNPCILNDCPIHIDTISMGLSIMHFKGSPVVFSQLCCISGFQIIKLEFILKLKIKPNDWLLADTCPQAANHCALF